MLVDTLGSLEDLALRFPYSFLGKVPSSALLIDSAGDSLERFWLVQRAFTSLAHLLTFVVERLLFYFNMGAVVQSYIDLAHRLIVL